MIRRTRGYDLAEKCVLSMKKLVLDVDETLVFSSNEMYSPACVELSAQGTKFYTSFRPGTKAFLEYVLKNFECWIWSTGQQAYLEALFEHLDLSGFTIWGRDQCVRTNKSETEPYEKPLRKITKDLTQIVIVDNTPSVYAKTPQNGIFVRTWRGEQNDTELEHLSYYLEWLKEQPSMQRDHGLWRMETLCLRSVVRGVMKG